MTKRQREIGFAVGRGCSIAMGVMGVVTMMAAESIVDNALAGVQALVGLMLFIASIGYYKAFKYEELYLNERGRRKRKHDKNVYEVTSETIV